MLSTLQTKKACGPDGIGPSVLQACASPLTPILHYLFSLSLKSGIVPTEWKLHNITPVFKSGDKSNVKNYRPISLLCIISKVLERLVYDKVLDYYSSSISHYQFGFCKNKSTLQQLLLFFNSLCTEKKQTDCIYLDFSKAFDSVPHGELLMKLWSVGITDKLWSWFRSYLFNRSQVVSINNQLSDPLPVKSGIPQGSILGPLLFIIYINDLSSSISYSNLLKFADDVKCYRAICNSNDSLGLQLDIDSLFQWSLDNKLSFNINKCTVLQYKPSTNTNFDTSYHINYRDLSKVTKHRDLGIIFTENLSWHSHHEAIVAKTYKSLGLLKRVFKHTISPQVKRTLYLTFARPKLSYCSPLWRPFLIKDILLLERVQRRATKFILDNYSMDYKSRLTQLKLLPLMYFYKLTDILFAIKSFKNPTDSFNIFQHLQYNKSGTRSSNTKLSHKTSINAISANSYFCRLPRLWNALPIIDLTLSFSVIKHKLHCFLWNHFIENFDINNHCTYHFLCPCNHCIQHSHRCNFNPL